MPTPMQVCTHPFVAVEGHRVLPYPRGTGCNINTDLHMWPCCYRNPVTDDLVGYRLHGGLARFYMGARSIPA